MGFVDKKIETTAFDKNKTIINLKSENKNFREIIKKLELRMSKVEELKIRMSKVEKLNVRMYEKINDFELK